MHAIIDFNLYVLVSWTGGEYLNYELSLKLMFVTADYHLIELSISIQFNS